MARIVARGGEAPRFRTSRVGGTLEVSRAFSGDSASMASRSRDLTLFGLLHSRCAFGIALALPASDRRHPGCGCSSVVEHDLAKVGVEGSSPFARSNFSQSTRNPVCAPSPGLLCASREGLGNQSGDAVGLDGAIIE